MAWDPPGKDCGSCGLPACSEFVRAVKKGDKAETDCPFYTVEQCASCAPAGYSGTDVTGAKYGFIIDAFPGEPSARKFIVPFRADLVEKWDIRPGALVTDRPRRARVPGLPRAPCPLCQPVTGVLACHTVGALWHAGKRRLTCRPTMSTRFEGDCGDYPAPPYPWPAAAFPPGLLHDGSVPHGSRQHGLKEKRRRACESRGHPYPVSVV